MEEQQQKTDQVPTTTSVPGTTTATTATTSTTPLPSKQTRINPGRPLKSDTLSFPVVASATTPTTPLPRKLGRYPRRVFKRSFPLEPNKDFETYGGSPVERETVETRKEIRVEGIRTGSTSAGAGAGTGAGGSVAGVGGTGGAETGTPEIKPRHLQLQDQGETARIRTGEAEEESSLFSPALGSPTSTRGREPLGILPVVGPGLAGISICEDEDGHSSNVDKGGEDQQPRFAKRYAPTTTISPHATPRLGEGKSPQSPTYDSTSGSPVTSPALLEFRYQQQGQEHDKPSISPTSIHHGLVATITTGSRTHGGLSTSLPAQSSPLEVTSPPLLENMVWGDQEPEHSPEFPEVVEVENIIPGPLAEGKRVLEDMRRMAGNILVNTGGVPNLEPILLPAKYNTHSDNPAWQWFKDHTMMNAVYDSAARDPPPRCYPGTRTTTLQNINDWLTNPRRERDIYWLRGVAGVGKSAIIQTLAESFSSVGRLGATLFFSRSHGRFDPLRIFPTLAYQFTILDQSYREYIAQVMLEHPGVLDKALDEQFRLLILEPFVHRNIRNGLETWAVTLDGLDECGGDPEDRGHEDDVQRDIVRLISEFTQQHPRAPLAWIIASRPEAHLKAVFSEADVAASRWEECVPVDSEEGSRDVKKFLGGGFTDIERKHSGSGRSWPPSGLLETVACAALGLFIFAKAALHFIITPGDPATKLFLIHKAISEMQFTQPQEIVFTTLNSDQNLLEDMFPSSTGNPFGYLEALCSHIMESIETAIRPTTWRILVFLCSIGKRELPAQVVASFLSLSRDDFYAALYRLHSILAIPEPDDASTLPVKFYHPSFRDFVYRYLMKKFAHTASRHLFPDVESPYYQWCDRWGNQFLSGPSVTEMQLDVSWPGEFIFGDIIQFVSTRIWELWTLQAIPPSMLYGRLRSFDFALHNNTGLFSQNIWREMYHPTPDITRLLLQLHTWESFEADSKTYKILRLEPACVTDMTLFDAYAYLINYRGMKKADFYHVEKNQMGWSYVCLSLKGQFTGLHCFPRLREALLNPRPMYFLLGHGINTCLVIMHRPMLTVPRFFKEAFGQIYAELTIDGDPYPSKNDLEKITLVSGVPQFAFSQANLPSLARTIVAFIGHPDYMDSANRLELVLGVLSHQRDQPTVLKLLRHQSLVDIPPRFRSVAGHVLAFLFCHATKVPGRAILANQISHFLELAEATVKKVLRMTYLILSSRPLPFPMDEVADFDLSDLREYCTIGDESVSAPESDHGKQNPPYAYETMMLPQTWLEVSVQYIRWCDYLLTENTVPKDDSSHHSESLASASDPNTTRQEETQFKQEILAGGHWIAFDRVARETAPRMAARLQGSIFFRMMALHCGFHLPHYDDMAVHFCSFVNKFHLYQTELDLEPLVRVERKCDMDDALLVEWKKQWDSCRQAVFPINSATRATFFFTTPETNWPAGTFSNGVWDYFWLGYDENTCLVTFLREAEDETEIVAGASTAEDLGT